QVTVSLQNKIVGSQTVTFAEFQLLESTTATTYETYKEDKTEILLPNEPLMGLPNGVSDIVDFDKNERTKNVGKYILDQNTDIVKDNELKNQNDTIAFYFSPNNKNIEYTSIISDKFMTAKIEDYRVNDVESISCGRAIAIRINRNKLETQDVAGFKKWLQTNPITVYYQLATPVTEKLNIKDTLQSFENGYIQLDNAITPTAQLEYSTNIPSAIGGLTQIADKLVDDVTNVEITISDMDAEIGEARKGKTTLEERLEDDRTNILNTTNKLDKSKYNREALAVDPAIDLLTFPPGHFRVEGKISTLQNYPINRDWIHATVEISGFMNDDTHQGYKVIIFTTNDGDVYMNTQTWDADKWSGWKQLATVDDTGWITLPLASGITVDGNITPQYRRVNNQVFICGSILGVDSSAKTVAILPVGFRPSRANYYVGFTTGTYTNAIRIDSNGNIIVQSNSSGTYDPTRFATLGTNFII
ncbi:hypothetical protein HYH46_14605, partial [Clostridium botulinum]|nr:hypothetical protein [Clostridium botulinum]